MLDLTKPVTTRDGRAVRILCTDVKHEYTALGVIVTSESREVPAAWTKDGACWAGDRNGRDDLINVPTKRTVWLVQSPDSNVWKGLGWFYGSREDAINDNKRLQAPVIGPIEIEVPA